MNEGLVLVSLGSLGVGTPSWGYGNSGTRSDVYPWEFQTMRSLHSVKADAVSDSPPSAGSSP
jgi:hypothetical protein